MTTSARSSLLCLLVLALAACGGGGGETRTTETTPATATSEPTQDAPDTRGEAAPPPAAANPPRMRVVHATNDPAAATIAVALDGDEDFVTGLAYGTGSGYVAVEEGRHSVVVHGPATDTGEPTIALASDVLEQAHAYTVFFVTQGAADAPFALYTGDDDDDPGPEVAAIRFFHAIQGVDDVDLCLPGATARAAGEALFADVARNALGSAGGLRYADLPDGEATLQVRAHSSPPCGGRMVGVGRFTPTLGTSYTAVAIGNPSGRPRAAAQLLVCRDAPAGDGGCDTVALAAH